MELCNVNMLWKYYVRICYVIRSLRSRLIKNLLKDSDEEPVTVAEQTDYTQIYSRNIRM